MRGWICQRRVESVKGGDESVKGGDESVETDEKHNHVIIWGHIRYIKLETRAQCCPNNYAVVMLFWCTSHLSQTRQPCWRSSLQNKACRIFELTHRSSVQQVYTNSKTQQHDCNRLHPFWPAIIPITPPSLGLKSNVKFEWWILWDGDNLSTSDLKEGRDVSMTMICMIFVWWFCEFLHMKNTSFTIFFSLNSECHVMSPP